MQRVAERMGQKSPRSLFNICETGNKDEINVALSEPRVVFWRSLDSPKEPWRRA